MSQRANPTLIGVFVFGAILIAIGAGVFFGSADFFSKKQTYVSYFNQSVSGLQVGSSVKFKGVTIGKVTKVLLGFVGEDKPVYAEVFYQVDENFVVKELGTNPSGVNVDLSDPQQHLKRLEQGLRARLDFESLISGQLYVASILSKSARHQQFSIIQRRIRRLWRFRFNLLILKRFWPISPKRLETSVTWIS